MTINLEQIAGWAANDWQVECTFENHGENASDADIGGINGWIPDNVIENATISVIDGNDDWHDFEVTRDQLMRIVGLHEVRKFEHAENEKDLGL